MYSVAGMIARARPARQRLAHYEHLDSVRLNAWQSIKALWPGVRAPRHL